MPRTPQRTLRQSFIVTSGDTVTGESGVGLTLTGGPTDGSGNGPPATLQGGTATASGAGGVAALVGGDAAGGVAGNVNLTPGTNTGGTLGVVSITRSGLQMLERSSVPGPAIASGQGRLWVRNDAATSLVFTDDTGSSTTLGLNAPERGYYSVLTYGATMTPSVDSRQAFQDACDACQAAGGGVVVVPPVLEPSTQAYLIDGTVTVGANVVVAGLGPRSIIRGRPATGQATFQFAAGLNRSGLRDLQILGNDSEPAGIGISFTGSQFNIVERVQVWDFEIGVDISDGATPFSAYNVLSEVEINRSTVVGIRAHQHANGFEIFGGRVFYTFDGSNGGVALSLDNARAVSINGLSIEAYDIGLRLAGATSGSITGTWMEKGANDPPGTDRVDFDVTNTFAESPFFEGNFSFEGNHYTDVWPLASGILSVKDFGAHGDGITEDTAAIQACIDQAIARGPGTAVFFPNGTYVSDNLNVQDATDLRIYGNEATLQWTGTAVVPNRVGLRLLGTCTRVKVDHLNMVGDGAVINRHAGVYSSSGSFLESCTVSDCAVSETTLGISFDMTSGGSYARNCVIERNRIEHIVGTDPGYGYGIHFADNSGEAAGHKVLFNQIHRCQRHAIYMALGRGVLVHGNSIFDHRDELDDGAVRFAMNLARTQFLIATNNQIIRSHNCSVGIAADGGGICEHVIFANNEIIDPVPLALPVPMMEVGLDIDTDGQANDVLIQGNKFVMNGLTSIDILRLNWGRRIVVRSNSFEATTANASTYGINLRGVGESTGTTTFSDDWTIQDNTFRIVDGGGTPTGAGIRMNPPFLSSGIRLLVGGSHGGGRNRYVTAASGSLASTITNPNIFSYEGSQFSWSTGTGPGSNPTRATNATTEVVTDTTGLRLENSGATNLSFLTGGFEGQEITLYGANGNTTLVNNAGSNGMRLAQSVNYTVPSGESISFKLVRGQWRETGRSEQLGGFFNVRSFGALASDAVDDSAAIQAAITAATAAGGGVVYFPPGTYNVSTTLIYTTNMTFQGAGTQATLISYSGTGFAFEQSLPGTRIYNVHFKDLQVTFANTADGGIHLNDVSLARFDSVAVFGPGIGPGNGSGIRVSGSTNGFAVYNAFYNTRVLSCEIGFDVQPTGSNDTHLIDCRTGACTRGLSIVDSNHVVAFSCCFESGTTGVYIESTSNALCDACTVAFCRFEGNTSANIEFGGSDPTFIRLPKVVSNAHVTGTAIVGTPTRLTNLGDQGQLQVAAALEPTPFRFERSVAGAGNPAFLVRDSNTGSGTPTTLQVSSGRALGHALSVNQWNGTTDTEQMYITTAGDIVSTAGATFATNLTFTGIASTITLGDGSSDGNAQVLFQKTAGGNKTCLLFRNGNTSTGNRQAIQFNTSSEIAGLTFDGSGVLLGIRPWVWRYSTVSGRNGLSVARFWADLNTALTSGNFATANWGSDASVSVLTNSRELRGQVTVTTGTTAIGASPTLTLTFPEGTWANAPFAVVGHNGGTGTSLTGFTWATTATTLVITGVGTPSAGETYIYNWIMMG